MKRLVFIICLLAISISPVMGNDYYAPPSIDFKQDLNNLSLGELKVLRNSIYALHGYNFESKFLSNYFWNKPWYQKIRREMEEKGTTYSADMLTRQEKNFIARVLKREKSLKRKGAKKARPSQKFNLDLIENSMQIPPLSTNARQMLEDNGFVVLPCKNKSKYHQFFYLYDNNMYHNMPSFITSDSVLQAYHMFFMYALRTAEESSLKPVAETLSQELLKRSLNTLKKHKNPDIKDAARLLTVYFAVANYLFTEEKPALPKALEEIFSQELKLINKNASPSISPLLGHTIDYSQFKIRGHYTRNKELGRYFKGMMWFANAILDYEKKDRHLYASALMTYYLMFYKHNDIESETPLLNLWKNLSEPIDFFVGKTDSLSPKHVRSALISEFGESVFRIKGVTRKTSAEAIRKELKRLNPKQIKPQGIVQGMMGMPSGGIRFLGKRYVPDTEIFQKLVQYGCRGWPTGLDLFDILKIPEATEVLEKYNLKGKKSEDCQNWYDTTRTKLIDQFESMSPDSWSQNLYYSWIDALRYLFKTEQESLPFFATTKAWRYKQLNTSLGSWTELRHNTLLYAEQACGAQCGGGAEPPRVPGYVEPVPEFYKRLNELLNQTVEGLDKRNMLPSGIARGSELLSELVSFLEEIARKELKHEPLTDKEYEQIRLYGTNLEMITIQITGANVAYWGEVRGTDRNVALVADLYNKVDEGMVLEEAVGPIDEIYVIVTIEGKPVLLRGGVFSYFEFKWPMGDRLTDEEWQKMLFDKKEPPRPPWTVEFSVPSECQSLPHIMRYDSGC